MPSSFRLGATVALASGCAALAHELLWTRRLVDLLGAGSEATARVLGCFFLGLALGSALSTRLVARLRRPWRALGLLELGIAVAALPALCLPWWTDWIWPSLGPARLTGWQGSAIKLAASVLVVLPPAFLMGMTLPVLARAVLDRGGRLGREGIWLYALNTLGGVIGLLLTVLWTLPAAGAAGAMAITMGVNLCVALACVLADRTAAELDPEVTRARPRLGTRGSWLWQAMGLSFVSGLGVLALEVLALHLLGNLVYSSLPATTALLTTVIGVLAFSAGVVPRLTRRFGPPSAMLPTLLFLAAQVIAFSPFWFTIWTEQMSLLPRAGTSTGYLLRVVSTSMVTLGPALLMAGLVLPLVFAWCDERGGPEAHRRWGWLLAANGVGGLVGAEAANLVLMPALGMHSGLGAVAGLYGLAALFVWLQARPRGRLGWRAAGFGLGVCLAFCALVWGLARQPVVNARIVPRALAIVSGRDGVVAVSSNPASGLGIVVNNKYVLGSSKGLHVERRQMLLPLLLHGSPRRVAHIGLATGITPGAALDHEGVEELVSVEISRSVATLALEHFTEFNRGLGSDPRATVVVEDGRTYLASATDEFDVIVGDLYRPYGAGEGRLYSIEHFRAARRALRPGGLFCQWLTLYQMTEPEFEVILATFLRVFPEAHLVRANLVAALPSIGVVGFRDADIDWSRMPQRCARLREQGRIVDLAVRHAEGVRLLYLGPIEQGFAATERINTLDNAWIEIDAGNSFVTRNPGSLQGKPWLDFEARLFQRLGLDSDPLARKWASLGREIEILELGSSREYATPEERQAALDEIRQRILELLPESMRNDPGADPAGFPAQ